MDKKVIQDALDTVEEEIEFLERQHGVHTEGSKRNALAALETIRQEVGLETAPTSSTNVVE